MVAGTDEDVRHAQLRRERLLDQADLQRLRLQPAERALRLGLAVDLLLQQAAQGVVGRCDVEFHAVPFRFSAVS